MASNIVSLIFQGDLRVSARWLKPSEAKTKSEDCYELSDESEFKNLYSRFLRYTAFPRAYLLKSFEEKARACKEIQCLKQLWKTPLFHYYPWVHSAPLLGKVESSIPGPQVGPKYFVVFELVNGEAKDPVKYFQSMATAKGRERFEPVLSLYQFCNAFSQVITALRKMHEINLYHCDVKPENILFKNNLLKIIDFDGANIILRQQKFYGTSRYLPGDALEMRGKSYEYLRELDLRLAATTFLIAFIEGFPEIVQDDDRLLRLKQVIDNRRNAYDESIKTRADPYPTYLKEYQAAKSILLEFANSDNLILKAFSVISLEPVDGNVPYEHYLRRMDLDAAKLFKGNILDGWRKLLRAKPLVGSLGQEPIFIKNMETLLSSFTSSIFSDYYPLVYLTYSKLTGWYDQPAATASAHAYQLLTNSGATDLNFIDVGSAFGSSAYAAFERGFPKGTLIDNSPEFFRLADLLWSDQSTSNAEWTNEVNSLLNDDIVRIYRAIFGMSTLGEARDRLIASISDTSRSFACYKEKARFMIRDYWGLYETDIGKYSYVLCNNMIHWPLRSFNGMQELGAIPRQFSLAKDNIIWLLKPIINLLNKTGVLIIIEPSLFLADDADVEADENYYKKRHNEHSGYKTVMAEVYSSLLPKIFEISTQSVSDGRQKWFNYSDLRTAVKNEYPSYSIRLLKAAPYPSTGTDWASVMAGAFLMNIRRLPEDQIRALLTADVEKWVEFYEQFRELVDHSFTDHNEVPLDTFYFVEICKNLSQHQLNSLPLSLSVCDASN